MWYASYPLLKFADMAGYQFVVGVVAEDVPTCLAISAPNDFSMSLPLLFSEKKCYMSDELFGAWGLTSDQ